MKRNEKEYSTQLLPKNEKNLYYKFLENFFIYKK